MTNPEKFDRIKKRQRNLVCCPYQEKGVDGKKDAVRSLQRAVGWCETVEEKQDTSSLSRSAELLMGKVSIDGILPLQRSTLLQRCDRAGADLAPRKSGTTEKSSSSSLFPAELRQEKETFFVSRFAHHMRSRTKTNYDFLGERNEYHDEKCKQIYPTVFSGKPSANAVGNQELSG